MVSLLGMDLHRAYIEAHQLEHGMSSELEAKLMERLGVVEYWSLHACKFEDAAVSCAED